MNLEHASGMGQTRREFCSLLAALGAFGLPVMAGCRRGGGLASERAWLDCPDVMKPGEEVFADLSRCCTGVEELPAAAVTRLHQLFALEPWGWKHIGTAYVQLADAARAHPGLTLDEVMALPPWRDGEAWFVKHLAITWWTGIYYRENQRPRHVLGREALCWQETGIAPGWVAHGPELWAKPPQGKG